jgi:hypothetical protein
LPFAFFAFAWLLPIYNLHLTVSEKFEIFSRLLLLRLVSASSASSAITGEVEEWFGLGMSYYGIWKDIIHNSF